MTKQYIARQSVGRFRSGDIVGGLNDSQISDLEQKGIIEEVKETPETKPTASTKTIKEAKVDG